MFIYSEIKWKNIITNSPKQYQPSISQPCRKDENEIAEDAEKKIESKRPLIYFTF